MDRNNNPEEHGYAGTESLSARRAWIEILIILYALIGVLVALRKESVDRNSASRIGKKIENGRSPQGERG